MQAAVCGSSRTRDRAPYGNNSAKLMLGQPGLGLGAFFRIGDDVIGITRRGRGLDSASPIVWLIANPERLGEGEMKSWSIARIVDRQRAFNEFDRARSVDDGMAYLPKLS